MIILSTNREVKLKKARIRKDMKKYGIMVKDLFSGTRHNPTTVKKAMSVNDPYWNQSIADLAQQLVSEKKGENQLNPHI